MAKKYYDDPMLWTYLKEINKIPNERKIPVGTVIYIPARDAKKTEVDVKKEREIEAELRAELEGLRDELRRARRRAEECEDEKRELANALEDCKDEAGSEALEEAKAKNKRLSKALGEKEAAIDELEAMCEKEMKAMARRKDKEMEAAAEECEAELRRKNRRIEELEEELMHCRRRLEDLEGMRDVARGKGRMKMDEGMHHDGPCPGCGKMHGEMKKAHKPKYTKEKCTDSRSMIAAVAIALVGSIVWIASN